MATIKQPEYWMRGPVENIAPLLQPAAHALLQAGEEVREMMRDFPQQLLWKKTAGMAPPAFHLLHLTGVINRLFTYAKGEGLTRQQLDYLAAETKEENEYTTDWLVQQFSHEIEMALQQLSVTGEKTLTEFRGVGRKQLPSTVLGLLFHAAEHTMRHTGQLLVTVQILKKELPGI